MSARLAVRTAIRSLRRSPGFLLVAVACVAAGTAAASAAYRMLDALLLRPPPGVVEPARMVRLYFDHAGSRFQGASPRKTSYPAFQDLAANAKSLASVAAFWERAFSLGTGAAARPVHGMFVTDSYFDVLGATPLIGAFPRSSAGGAGGGRDVVLSEALWRDAFGSRRDILGTTVVLEGEALTVVAVAQPEFRGTESYSIDLWLPIALAPSFGKDADILAMRNAVWVDVVARLRRGATANAAATEIETVLRELGYISPDATKDPLRRRITVAPLNRARGPDGGLQTNVTLLISALSVLLLAATCVNTAGLFLVRAMQRSTATAVRIALGARVTDVLLAAVAEGVIVAVVGIGLGGVLSLWANGAAVVLGAPLPSAPDARFIGLAAGLAVVIAAVCGVGPAFFGAVAPPGQALRKRSQGVSRGMARTYAALLAIQVSLTFALLVSAAVFGRRAVQLAAVDLRMDDPAGLFIASVDASQPGMGPAEIAARYERLRDRALAGGAHVRAVALASAAPFGNRMIDEVTAGRTGAKGMALWIAADPSYTATTGLGLRAGRWFIDADRRGAARVAVVNEALARQLWPNESPLHKCLVEGGVPVEQCRIVVGVVATAKFATIDESPSPAYYVPLAQAPRSAVSTLLIRADRGTDAGVLHRALQTAEPTLPYVRVRSLDDVLAPQLRPWRVGALVFSAFGGVALLLAAIGLYAIASLIVSRRAHEIGVRMALGGRPLGVVALVLRSGLAPALAGVLAGAAALTLGRRTLVESWVPPSLAAVLDPDLAVFGIAAAIVALVLTIALVLPARRAAGIDPVVVLRSD